MTERRRQRLTHAVVHAAAAVGLLLIAVTGRLADAGSWSLSVPVIVSLALLSASHLVLTREIHRREHTERALHDANRELESFSYSVSHDLRAPLRSIDGFSQALVEDAGPALAPDMSSHLHRIRSATQRMGRLIDDLLALSKVSRAEMARQRIDVSDLARSEEHTSELQSQR